jgi:hypothetical protein
MPRRQNQHLAEQVELTFDHAAQTADLTVKLWKCPAGRSFVLDSAEYVNPTGLAADAANYFNLKVLKGAATVAANWSTETGQQGAIAADTFVSLVNGSLANRTFAAADVMSFMMDETGTQTLPAGRLVLRGRYV